MAIEDAPGQVDLGAGDPGYWINLLPVGEDDFTWDDLTEMIFQNLDLQMLFNDGELDGVESPDDPLNQEMDIGDYRPEA